MVEIFGSERQALISNFCEQIAEIMTRTKTKPFPEGRFLKLNTEDGFDREFIFTEKDFDEGKISRKTTLQWEVRHGILFHVVSVGLKEMRDGSKVLDIDYFDSYEGDRQNPRKGQIYKSSFITAGDRWEIQETYSAFRISNGSIRELPPRKVSAAEYSLKRAEELAHAAKEPLAFVLSS